MFDGNPEDGLTVALHVDSRGRGDVLDLARVVEDDGIVQRLVRLVGSLARAAVTLLAAAPPRELRTSRSCVPSPSAFDISDHPTTRFEPASRSFWRRTGFVFDFDGRLDPELPLVWIAAPAARDCVLDVLVETRI